MSFEPATESEPNTPEPVSVQSIDFDVVSNVLLENDLLKQMRKRSFLYWPHSTAPSAEKMIEAGFFSCKIHDRVMCIYCDLICEQWRANIDHPYEVHKTLSQSCRYIKALPIVRLLSSNLGNETSDKGIDLSILSNDTSSFRFSQQVTTVTQNYIDDLISINLSSFSVQSIDQLLRTNDTTQGRSFNHDIQIHDTFHCNQPFQSGELNEKTQEYIGNRKPDEKIDSASDDDNTPSNIDGDPSAIFKSINEKLDFPIPSCSKEELRQLFVSKRREADLLCIGDKNDRYYNYDLYMDTLILLKQLKCINGDQTKVFIPRDKMKAFLENGENEKNFQSSTVIPPNLDGSTLIARSILETATDQTQYQEGTMELTDTDANVDSPTPDTKLFEHRFDDISKKGTLACLPCCHIISCAPSDFLPQVCLTCCRPIEDLLIIG